MSFRPLACPACGVSWVGEEIPAEMRHHYGDVTRFRRCIGIYDIHLDMRVAIACPDCKALFDRWTGMRIASVPHSKKMN